MKPHSGGWNENRAYARRHLPRGVFDFIDGAAEEEFTSRENRSAFENLTFKSRLLARVGTRDQSVEVLGQRLAVPIITAPTGLSRLAGPAGEKGAAVGAEANGTVSILSASTSTLIARVAGSVSTPQWLQIYLWNDEERTLAQIRAAHEHGFRVLVVTADAPISGNRERDTRNGMSIPFRVRPRMALNVLTRPRWLYDYLAGPPIFEDHGLGTNAFLDRVLPGRDQSIAKVMRDMFNANQGWDDLKRIRELWDGPLVLKGVMCAEDARLAVEAGCEGVVVSNHGGRQLDGLPASIDVLPEVVSEIGRDADVLLDGGVRRGADVVKALALGAKACLIGRPWIFGLARGGARGVDQVISTMSEEVDRVMALVGASSVADLSPVLLRRRRGAGWDPLGDAGGGRSY